MPETSAPQAYGVRTLPEFLRFLEWNRSAPAVDVSVMRMAAAAPSAASQAGLGTGLPGEEKMGSMRAMTLLCARFFFSLHLVNCML